MSAAAGAAIAMAAATTPAATTHAGRRHAGRRRVAPVTDGAAIAHGPQVSPRTFADKAEACVEGRRQGELRERRPPQVAPARCDRGARQHDWATHSSSGPNGARTLPARPAARCSRLAHGDTSARVWPVPLHLRQTRRIPPGVFQWLGRRRSRLERARLDPLHRHRADSERMVPSVSRADSCDEKTARPATGVDRQWQVPQRPCPRSPFVHELSVRCPSWEHRSQRMTVRASNSSFSGGIRWRCVVGILRMVWRQCRQQARSFRRLGGWHNRGPTWIGHVTGRCLSAEKSQSRVLRARSVDWFSIHARLRLRHASTGTSDGGEATHNLVTRERRQVGRRYQMWVECGSPTHIRCAHIWPTFSVGKQRPLCRQHLPTDLHPKHNHPHLPWRGAPADHMTGPAAVDGDGMQWAECEFWVEGRRQLRAWWGGGVTASGGPWCRLTKAACTVHDDAPSRYTRNWRHRRTWWAPSPGWDEWWWHN